MSELMCPICNQAVWKNVSTNWIFRCKNCGIYAAPSLPVEINQNTCIDETKRAAALQQLRSDNAIQIIKQIQTHRHSTTGTLLDIGCAHGWFLSVAAKNGFSVEGIEPDEPMASIAQSQGFDVRVGFFPEVLKQEDKFDVITLNDVVEHLPNPVDALQSCWQHLNPKGMVVISLPLATGALYQIATLLKKVGIGKPLDRLWQVGFPSPHLFYFTPKSLHSLAEKIGFRVIAKLSTTSVSRKNLWERLSFDRSSSRFFNAVLWCILMLIIPVFNLLPSDTETYFLVKNQ